MSKFDERPDRSLVRVGPVMERVLLHLALQGPSFPWEIHQAIETSDAAVYKAVTRLYTWGWIDRVKDPTHESPDDAAGHQAYRHYYSLTERGWWHLERHLIPRGMWTVALMQRRETAIRRAEFSPSRV